jgi:small subunit ribosomal protein S3
VGQKIHPTGFRIGSTKTHSSIWYANYRVYGEALKEDYNIRQFFEKNIQFKKNKESIYWKAGITKIELQRKVNQLELLIHAARPKAIAQNVDKNNFILKVKESIKTLVGDSKQIRIKVVQVKETKNASSLVSRSIADQLEKRVAFRKAIRQATEALQKSGVKGFKIQVSGRLNGAEIARAEWAREGRVPLQTLRADINYATSRANTIYGILGIKVWIFNKEIF